MERTGFKRRRFTPACVDRYEMGFRLGSDGLLRFERRLRMGHYRPICRRNVAVLERISPKRLQAVRILGCLGAAHGAGVTSIDGFLQGLATSGPTSSQFHRSWREDVRARRNGGNARTMTSKLFSGRARLLRGNLASPALDTAIYNRHRKRQTVACPGKMAALFQA